MYRSTSSVQIALGFSMAKNSATELKKHDSEAVADVLAKTLTGVVLSPTSPIAEIMAVVNRILPMGCKLPGGKTFSAVISEGFEFVADGSVAGHVDLLGRAADAMEHVSVAAIDMKVINKLQQADRPLAIKQRKAHLTIQMDTTFVSIDVIVYKALISTLDPAMQKTVATTTSTIEMLAAIWIFKNYGWYTRSKEAVKGLTNSHVFDVNPQTSFDAVVEELLGDVRNRLESVLKTGLSPLGMAVMMSLGESIPQNKDQLQSPYRTICVVHKPASDAHPFGNERGRPMPSARRHVRGAHAVWRRGSSPAVGYVTFSLPGPGERQDLESLISDSDSVCLFLESTI